jgi:hypothetical protein
LGQHRRCFDKLSMRKILDAISVHAIPNLLFLSLSKDAKWSCKPICCRSPILSDSPARVDNGKFSMHRRAIYYASTRIHQRQ